MKQNYILTIRDLFTMNNGVLAGAEAEISIMDGETEVDRLRFSGKCQSPQGYRKSYSGKLGLTAKLVSGVGQVTFEPDWSGTSSLR
ncbi:hypothetical protein [Pseudomonas sp. ZL2]